MKGRILIVDDEPAIRAALERALRRHQYDVLTAANPGSAYTILAGSEIDVVLLDWRLPELSGDALYFAIVCRWPQLRGRIILMSGHPDIGCEAWPEELHACPVLEKPFTLESLYAIVAAIMDRHAMKRSHKRTKGTG